MPKYARIVCTKCGQTFASPGYACSKCQGPLTKLCGNCGFSNSVAKNYCDRCGTPMALDSGAGGAPASAPADGGLFIPAPRSSEPLYSQSQPAPDFQPPQPITETSMVRLRSRDRRQAVMFWLPIVAVVVMLGMIYREQNRAERAAPRAAMNYLNALQHGDIAGAYALLSQASQAHCPIEEFRAMREGTPWTWDNLRVLRTERGAVSLQYQLRIQDREPIDDYMVFIHENGAWVRPYNWNLLQKAEDALDRNDPDMALLLAQVAARINPTDPMARGYICEAAYYRKISAQTEHECALALDLSRKYPSKLSAQSLFHLRAILGDNYKNQLGKPAEAAAQYTELLNSPDITPAEKCDVLLSRADAYTAMGESGPAAQDFTQAAAACRKPEDLQYIRRRQAGQPADQVKSARAEAAAKMTRLDTVR